MINYFTDSTQRTLRQLRMKAAGKLQKIVVDETLIFANKSIKIELDFNKAIGRTIKFDLKVFPSQCMKIFKEKIPSW